MTDNTKAMQVNITYNLDALSAARLLPDGCVDCIVTSPPYYGLRDYGVDGQIGLEETPEAFIEQLVSVFRELRRVLKPEGTLWVNMGDSYNSYKGNAVRKNAQTDYAGHRGQPVRKSGFGLECKNLKNKDLIGIPWMLAFALRADGWYLRQDIVWHKPNPMPESVTDRCTKAHEYIFLFSKSPRYYFDAEAIKEPAKNPADDMRRIAAAQESHKSAPDSLRNGIRQKVPSGWNTDKGAHGAYHRDGRTKAVIGGRKRQRANDFLVPSDPMYRHNTYREYEYTGKANKRSVWTVATKPFKEAHFATFPEDLIVPCILAGCPAGGLVLDPFNGSGTTRIVANKLSRNAIGFELNPEYIEIENRRRSKELGMFENTTL